VDRVERTDRAGGELASGAQQLGTDRHQQARREQPVRFFGYLTSRRSSVSAILLQRVARGHLTRGWIPSDRTLERLAWGNVAIVAKLAYGDLLRHCGHMLPHTHASPL